MESDRTGGVMNTRMIPILLLAALLGGCWGRSSAPMQPTINPLRVTPEDGASGVRLDAPATFDFGAIVDRSAAERGIHLIAEPDMLASCPDSSMGDHGTMETMMDDAAMLRHLDDVHSTRGSYTWNAAGTVCTFQPDSLMRPQTQYMVHMSGAMLEMMRQRHGSMMGGRMNDGGDMMLHFQTMNADGHGGHH